ncbi:MAG: site-specific DNA-methyltransferase [Chloroflexi bacterium]|nr:site-specific DNA-methyltransferase [Chloroflexota bacterium]
MPPTRNFDNRTLYHGDNLEFLRGMNSGTVNLIATDPPFNKGRDFHATPDSLASGAQFQDRWRWDEDVHDDWLIAIQRDQPEVWAVITAAKTAYGDDMAAYLCWLGVRLLEMHRVLAEDGSIYLHMDDTAGAWGKCLLDAIFGRQNFRNAIVWKRTRRGFKGSQFKARRYNSNTDTLLFYGKTDDSFFDQTRVLEPYAHDYMRAFRHEDSTGPYYLDLAYNRPSASPRPNLCYEYRGFTPPILQAGKLDRSEWWSWTMPGSWWRKTGSCGAKSAQKRGGLGIHCGTTSMRPKAMRIQATPPRNPCPSTKESFRPAATPATWF